MIASGLMFFNGIAQLSPGFFVIWTSFLPWVVSLGTFGFILGVILGLVLLGALVLIFLGFRVQAAFLIFPAAIVSLLIGGDFIAGIVTGILAGMLILINEKFSMPSRVT